MSSKLNITPTTLLAPFEAYHEDIAYSRSGNGYRVAKNGLYVPETSDQWRLSYNPANGRTEGWPAFEATTNSLLDNRDFSTGNWAENGTPTKSQNQTGIDGQANKAWTLGDDDDTSGEDFQQSIAVADDSNTHSYFYWIKKDSDTSRFPAIGVSLQGGTRQDHLTHINTSDGSIADEKTEGTSQVFDKGDWWLLHVTITNNGTGNTTLTSYLYPARGTTLGTNDAGATGTAVFDMPCVYLNQSFISPPIETAGSTATRDADSADITGLDTADWFKQGEGSVYFEGINLSDSGTHFICELHDSTTDNRIMFRSVNGTINARIDNNGSTVASVSGPAIPIGDVFKAVISWKDGHLIVGLDGTTSSDTASFSVPNSITDMNIGSNVIDSVHFAGYMEKLYAITHFISESTAQSITS